MNPEILSVSELTEQIRKNIERRFVFLWVQGEISNLSRPSSGHIYFVLKDAQAQINCVWFAHQQHLHGDTSIDPFTGEVMDANQKQALELLDNGHEILCAGKIGVYALRGQYQLVVEHVQPVGRGCLSLAFEVTKQKLEAAGYFAVERKRPLPRGCSRIAVITSPSGAAISDFCKIANQRGGASKIIIYPVTVQGNNAAGEIVSAFEKIRSSSLHPHVIVLIRGGGSLEDLNTFNQESVATAIFNSPIPVIAGIGHEIDVTLADMTADIRAATPSHAAQLLWPLRSEIRQHVDDLSQRLSESMKFFMTVQTRKLAEQEKNLSLLTPKRQLQHAFERFSLLSQKMIQAANVLLRKKSHSLLQLEVFLRPSLPFERINTYQNQLRYLDKSLFVLCDTHVSRASSKLDGCEKKLSDQIFLLLARFGQKLDTLQHRLRATDPSLPLKRGFAVVRTTDGTAVTSTAGLAISQKLDLELSDGHILVGIEKMIAAHNREEHK